MDSIVAQKITLICLIWIAVFILLWLVHKALNRLIKKLSTATESGLDDAILYALRPPILLAVIFLGVWFTLQQAQLVTNRVNPQVLRTAFFLIYWILGFMIVYRLVVNLSIWYQHEVAPKTNTSLDEQVIPFARRIILIGVSIVAVIILLGYFDVKSSTISAFITTLGITSLAVALAAQPILEDTFSGFSIMVDRPFRIGDRIELQELDTWGDVTDIGLRTTRILTRDHRMVVVPNSQIVKNSIVNHSIPSTIFRVQTEVAVAYGIELEYVRNILVSAVSAQEWVMPGKPVEALFLEFQDSGLLFRVRCWIEDYVETRRAIDKLNTAIYNALTEADIEIPFPQHVVHLQNEA